MGKHSPVGSGFSMADFSLDRLLGGLSPERFLSEYWQKKPLLVRQALPGFGDWLDRGGLSDLACRDDAESRLVRFQRKQCLLDHGPFEREDLDALPKRGWSLLVSGMNHLLPQGDELLHRFDFIPQARLDDLMVSFAPPGGGVGPHFDSYDVFLIQGLGRRRWEISGQNDLEVVDGAPLRILKRFRVDQSWEVEPGDMLYLPPRFAHNGVALTDCMTWSVGFRAPKAQEIAARFLDYLQDNLELEGMYADAGLKRPANSGEIPTAMIDWAGKAISVLSWNKSDIADFLGCYLSEPKAHVFFDPPSRPLTLAAFRKRLATKGMRLDPRSQLLFRQRRFFMNGEPAEVSEAMAKALRELAHRRHLECGEFETGLLSLLHLWYQSGYLILE
ncbi:MAG TPA: cupin domain-containing protein [Rhodocyclaceae bacterium]|nr:cupin domain-containing protein [Rhodocyclaceae bacterium]